MNGNDEARWAKAAMKSIRVPAPESLKADLKRLARERQRTPSLWVRLQRLVDADTTWAYGAGAVFAAAAIGVFILRTGPERIDKGAAIVSQHRTASRETVVPTALADLWADDTGEDNDDI